MRLPNEIYEQIVILLLNSWVDAALQPEYTHRLISPLQRWSSIRSKYIFTDIDYPDTLLNFARASRTWAPRIEFLVRQYRDSILSPTNKYGLTFEAKLAMKTHLNYFHCLSSRPQQTDAKYKRYNLLRQAAQDSWPRSWTSLKILPRLREVVEELEHIKKSSWRESGEADFDDFKAELEELVREETRDYRDRGWIISQMR